MTARPRAESCGRWPFLVPRREKRVRRWTLRARNRTLEFGVARGSLLPAHPKPPTSDEPDAFPPVVRCVRCGQPDCAGCDDAPRAALDPAELAWEAGRGTLGSRLWATAVASSVEPGRTFGLLQDGPLASAFAFSLLAETLAIGSVGLVALGLSFALVPELTAKLLSDAVVLGFAAAALIGASLLMVLLHAVWGLCLEWGAQRAGSPARFRYGLRFGFYACGWDLLTSPLGLAHEVLTRGPRRGLVPVLAAIRVPRSALEAYLVDCRQLSTEAKRHATRISLITLASLVVLIAIGGTIGALGFASYCGLL